MAWIYLTPWMTKDQTVHFHNDICDQDKQLEATAEKGASVPAQTIRPVEAGRKC